MARRLEIAFHALGIGSEVGNEGIAVTHEFKVHGRIVHQCGLMQVQVDTVVGLELQRGLHTVVRENGL